MESLIAAGINDIRLVWLAYAVLVLLAYGCWWALCATLTSHWLLQSLMLWPVWVVLFSISPIALDREELAPTAVVTLFAWDGDNDALLELTGLWWLVGGLSATLYFLVVLISRELWRLHQRNQQKRRQRGLRQSASR